MALWGNKDSVYADGTVTVDYSAATVTGSGTTFTPATSGIATGNVITITGHGSAVISGITSATLISIASTSGLSGSAISGVAYVISEQPSFLVGDTNWGGNEIYGVDEIEVGVAATTEYAVTHEGWVGLTTYTDAHGNLRVKHEVIVAGGILTTTDAEDTIFADS